jgi:hypothetical protein
MGTKKSGASVHLSAEAPLVIIRGRVTLLAAEPTPERAEATKTD